MGKNLGNELGSTLIETLIAFFCFLTVLFLFPTIISGFHHPKHVLGSWLKPMEVQLFFEELSKEVRGCTKVVTSWNSIHLYKDNGEVVSYEKYGWKVRRRVNNRGHEIILTNIRYISFIKVVNGVVIEVKGEKGRKYRKRISLSFYR
jgi:competence protein ComGF